MTFRIAVASLALAALVATGAQTFFLKTFTSPDQIEQVLRAHPDKHFPGYSRFIHVVKERTDPGESIALVHPVARWEGDDGYGYAFMRANYLLPRRELIQLIDDDGSRHPERISEAEWVAAWGTKVRGPGLRVTAEMDGGTLYRRVEE